MFVFKCKMCGTLEFELGSMIVDIRDCCDTKQTFPSPDDVRRVNQTLLAFIMM